MPRERPATVYYARLYRTSNRVLLRPPVIVMKSRLVEAVFIVLNAQQ
jgi:hypothetical protein